MNSLRFFRFIAISCLLATIAVSLCADTLSHTWAPENWQLAWEQSFSYGQIALSPDGTLLAVPYYNGDIAIFRTSDHTRVRVLHGSSGEPNCISPVVFSPNGKVLAKATEDTTAEYRAQLWNVADGTTVEMFKGEGRGVSSVAFSPDGRWFALATEAEVWLYRITYSPHINMNLVRRYTGHTHDVTYVTFSPDSTQIASGGTDVQLWRVADGQLQWTTKDFAWPISCLAFSPDGSRLVTGTWSDGVSVWQCADGSLIKNLSEGLGRTVRSITFSPHGGWLSVTSGGNAQLWRTADLTLVRTIEVLRPEKLGHYRDFTCVAAFMPDGKTLVTGSPANAVQFWHVADGTLTSTLQIQTGFSDVMAFSPDNAWLAVEDPDGGMQLWHLPDRVAPQTFPDEQVGPIVFSPDGRWFASGGASTIRIRRVADWHLAYEFNLSQKHVEYLAFSADSKTINAVCNFVDDYYFCRWDLSHGKLLGEKHIKIDDAVPFTISPDGTTIFFRTRQPIGRRIELEYSIYLYNMLDGALVQRLPFPDAQQLGERYIYGPYVSVSADGHWLAIGVEPNIYIWQLPAGKLVSKLKSPTNPATTDQIDALTLTPDGQRVVANMGDSKIRVWRIADGTLEETLTPTNAYFDRIQFSPDGRWLACLGHGGLSVFQTGESTMMNNKKRTTW